ncbi:hypothetical protein F5878DRAFT_549821 [Lentinula raphanica]|uniref:CxC1-like cysteine cluster associated with KDZ transposases domain-containing protein n=1 Tax=Lentinula raphanica TaxID=153919 RepID=A0AA38NV54_9AGAR|nr:hypothetical protein F5878DRAFT_549821 [Lentinula raphanica]
MAHFSYSQYSRWRGRKYRDTRTWGQRIRRFNAAWEPLIKELADRFIEWKYSTQPNPTDGSSEYNFTIPVVDIHTLDREVNIQRPGDMTVSHALMRAGYLGSSPEQPSLAVSLQTLELFRTLRLFKPNLSVEAFAKTICHLYSKPYRRSYRTALSDTFDVYLSIVREVDARVASELGHDEPNYRVLHSCPSCSYELEGETELRFSRMFVIDGNNSLKRMKGFNGRTVADTRVFDKSDYYLSREYVDQYADEVKARRPSNVNRNPEIDNEDADEWEDVVHGDVRNPKPWTRITSFWRITRKPP